jgi:hypothetical protein
VRKINYLQDRREAKILVAYAADYPNSLIAYLFRFAVVQQAIIDALGLASSGFKVSPDALR